MSIASAAFGEISDSERQQAIADGRSRGFTDGYIYILQSGEDAVERIPDRTKVLNDYTTYLSGKTLEYRNNFYIGYVEGYLEGMREAKGIFRESGSLPEISENYGSSLGTSLGEAYGARDFYNGLTSSWGRAIPTNRKLDEIFDLGKQNTAYKSRFYASFRDSFRVSYERGYENANLRPSTSAAQSGKTHGQTIGATIGTAHGNQDYFSNLTINYKRNMPTDAWIINEYKLNLDMEVYRDAFLAAFKQGYEEAYHTAYRDIKISLIQRLESDALEAGRIAGSSKGSTLAQEDYILGRRMDWTSHRSIESNFMYEYNLFFQSPKYRRNFTASFWEGFSNAYTETYTSLNRSDVGGKISSGIIPLAGGSLSSSDGALTISIEPGIFYEDVMVTIEEKAINYYNYNQNRYIKASNPYNVKISVKNTNLDNSIKIPISFPYYGERGASIYKWVNNSWQAMPSQIGESSITSLVSPSTLINKDNIYMILVDRNHKVFRDIRSHWASDEIQTLISRDIIFGYGDSTFKPDNNISRGEFLTLLSRQYRWTLPNNVSNIEVFKDYNAFGNRDKIISYAISKGYIKGYEDKTFRPNSPISYREVEIIMGRLLENPNFRWYNVSSRMLYEKLVRSRSYNSMDNFISRAEVSYMLYVLNEWRY